MDEFHNFNDIWRHCHSCDCNCAYENNTNANIRKRRFSKTYVADVYSYLIYCIITIVFIHTCFYCQFRILFLILFKIVFRKKFLF